MTFKIQSQWMTSSTGLSRCEFHRYFTLGQLRYETSGNAFSSRKIAPIFFVEDSRKKVVHLDFCLKRSLRNTLLKSIGVFHRPPSNQGLYSQTFIFLLTCEMGPIDYLLHYTKLEMFARENCSSLLSPFVSWEENEALWIWFQGPYSQHFIFFITYK